MKPLYLKNGSINFQLSAYHCARAATACWAAGEERDSEEQDDWHLLALMFQAGAQAGYAQWHINPADEAAFEEQLRLAGLEEMARHWERETVQESPFIQTLLEDSYKRGHQAGKRDSTLAALAQILKIRFDVDLEEAVDCFDRLDVTALQHLNAVALTAETLVAFKERVSITNRPG